ncbi:putative bifunctional diguanylate cyclase/phosphodiesterase [Ectopseudomonas toyotomiensis]|uniref:EAL domain-containing protein n=1 Tax=Ectopseudomonas toyotomiensis TaxID=554344 RepID=A0AA42LGW9_9GAMM|nr:EAL domain-containing protein [Pseudomonas toyotomiensis]MBG0839497.1 EAL domain-containing protein [Pseudomonas toyotomiensis]MDH0701537.1 EAL domain-containing protein [Pseudomonas toyotomiensis]
MLRSSFQARIAGVLILLLLVVIGALYVAVKAATDAAVRAQAQEQLNVGSLVFEQLLALRSDQLQQAAQVLAADFGFKEAVASGDAPTIRSALANQGARINADAVFLLGLDGSLQVSTDPDIDAEALARLDGQLQLPQRDGAQLFLLPIGRQIYLLVDATVSAPLPIARVLMGFAVDREFAVQLRELTHLELSLMASRDGAAPTWISTLPASAQALLEAQMKAVGAMPQRLDGGSEHYFGQHLQLASGPGYRVEALLHKSLGEAEAAFAQLDRRILLISLGAMLASLVGALLLARSVSRPVRELAAAAQRIGRGDYQQPVALARSDELGVLALAVNDMQRGIAERERQLAHNALHDALTGLPNRTLALERLGSAITAGRPTALLYLGMGNFAAINESCGQGGGDLALQQLARRLQATLRPGDSLARLVGDEFLLLLEQCDGDSAVASADRLHQLLLKPLRIGTLDVALDCRIGIAAYPADGDTPDDLLRRARIAMQDAAQHSGRLQLYQQGRDAAQQRQIRLIRDLRHAAAQGQLLLHYQPKLDIREGLVRQAEALLRWQHPQLGMVSPGEFIPLAERTGSIQLLSAWVIEEAMRQLQEWDGRGVWVQLSLNISTADLLDAELPGRVGALLARYRVAPEQLIFEITESGVMLDPERALQVLHGLRGYGIGLSVDDFGTGYSSLAQLKRMPVQELKIDQSFIRELDDHSEDSVIVRSTIEMSHSLGLKVVAEGVELASGLNLLQRWHCDTAQGYLISRPLAAEAFEAWLAQPYRPPLAKVH